MSLCQTAFLPKSKFPTHTELQAALDASEFDIAIDDYYKPLESEGFVPCRLNGNESGFELFWQPLEEIFEAWPNLRNEIGDADTAMTFIWHGDMAECACVLIVSYVLAKSFGATVFYQDDEILYTLDDLLAEAKAVLADI